MLCALLSTFLRLQKWKENPGATKREIGLMSQWLTSNPENDRPLTDNEIETMKDFLRLHAPTSCSSLFPV